MEQPNVMNPSRGRTKTVTKLSTGVAECPLPHGRGSDCAQAASKPIPLAYLITFTCYGTRLHGDEPESVDRRHNVPGSPFLARNPSVVSLEERDMGQKPYRMDARRRALVLRAILEVCSHKRWILFAAHVRATHLHIVVGATEAPERIMNALKAYSSRALNQAKLEEPRRRRWSHHGSTRYLWKEEQVGAAIHYVVREQGEPMAVWEDSKRTL